MRIMSKYLRRRLSHFVAGICAAAAAAALGSGDLPLATVMALVAALLIAPSLPLGSQLLFGRGATK